MANDKPQGTEPVTLEPIKWVWECPMCGTNNIESDIDIEDTDEIVVCSHQHCGVGYFVNYTEAKNHETSTT